MHRSVTLEFFRVKGSALYRADYARVTPCLMAHFVVYVLDLTQQSSG
jgi:hypothetical protein